MNPRDEVVRIIDHPGPGSLCYLDIKSLMVQAWGAGFAAAYQLSLGEEGMPFEEWWKHDEQVEGQGDSG